MKGNNFVTIASVLLAVASISFASGRTAQTSQAPAQPVLVTNTTSQCVPVSLYHSIAVPSSQSGAWNTGTVGDKLPFYHSGEVVTVDSTYSSADSFAGPVGKRLIIDGISFSSTAINASWSASAVIRIYSPSAQREAFFMNVPVGGLTNNVSGNAMCHLIVESGDTIQISFTRNGTSNICYNEYSMEGHYAL